MKNNKTSSLLVSSIERKISKGAEILYVTRSKRKSLNSTHVDLSNCVLFDRKELKNSVNEIYIKHPYVAKKYKINYTEHTFLDTTKEIWKYGALERIHPTATLLVNKKTILSSAGNGLTYHTLEMCERKKLQYPTGQGYHLCNGNHLSENHSESKAVRQAPKKSTLKGATAYMYGHWWSCEGCSSAMEKAGIKELFLSKSWTKKFLGI